MSWIGSVCTMDCVVLGNLSCRCLPPSWIFTWEKKKGRGGATGEGEGREKKGGRKRKEKESLDDPESFLDDPDSFLKGL